MIEQFRKRDFIEALEAYQTKPHFFPLRMIDTLLSTVYCQNIRL